MAIYFQCPGCGKHFRGIAEFVRDTLKCPHCEHQFQLPTPEPVVAPPPAATPTAGGSLEPRGSGAEELAARDQENRGAVGAVKSPRPPSAFARNIRPHLHWGLLLALLPLLYVTAFPGESFRERVKRTIQEHPEVRERLAETKDFEQMFDSLPGHRLAGAFLARESWLHCGFALLAALAFCALLALMLPNPVASFGVLAGMGLFTSTAGIVLLFAVQIIAESSQSFVLVRGGILGTLLFLIVRFIGFSYHAANDPRNGLLVSFVGFTCGVGLCEELCKSLPLLAFLRISECSSARFALAIGMASGIGFGVAEGVSYSAIYYNGVEPEAIYVVRFLSCVALHAIWAGSVALLMFGSPFALQGRPGWEMFGLIVINYLLFAMVLHGLYDTLLKLHYPAGALLVALASFGWLDWLIQRYGDSE